MIKWTRLNVTLHVRCQYCYIFISFCQIIYSTEESVINPYSHPFVSYLLWNITGAYSEPFESNSYPPILICKNHLKLSSHLPLWLTKLFLSFRIFEWKVLQNSRVSSSCYIFKIFKVLVDLWWLRSSAKWRRTAYKMVPIFRSNLLSPYLR